MKKLIVLVVVTVCMVMSGYTYAKYKIAASENRNGTSNASTNNGQAVVKNSDRDTNPVSDSNDKNQPVDSNSDSSNNDSKNVPGNKNQTTTNTTVTKGSQVVVDISEQRVYVYNSDKLFKTMVCSTGIENENYKTPRGNYIINESGVKKGEWFYSNKYQEGAKYWVGFIGGTYLFHSVPMDINKNIIEDEADKLGTPASHGCVRLDLDDAYWFYKNIKSGTKLIIQD